MAAGRRAGAALLAGGGLLPAAPLWLWWAVWDGGYPAAVFLPGLLLLVAVTVLLAGTVPVTRPGRAAGAALALLTAFTAWTWLSLTWADEQGLAWLAAERTTLLVVAFALPVLWPPSARGLVAGVGAWAAAVGAGAAAGLLGTLRDPGGFGLDGRLAAPALYVNATAAMLVMGALCCIGLAAQRERPVALRGAAVGLGAGLAAVGVLAQSRGAVAAGAAGLLVLVALHPRRFAVLSAAVLVAAPLLVALDPLLDVRTDALLRAPDAVLRSALPDLVRVTAVGVVLGVAWALADRLLVAPAATARTLRRGGWALTAVAVVAGAIVFVGAVGSPVSWAQDRWADFKTENYAALEASDNRFTGSLGSNRYDYWRVAADLAAEHPLTGVGAANFATPYVARRHTDKGPLYAHSLWLQTLGDLGWTGLALLVAAVLAAALAVVAAARRLPRTVRGTVAAAVTPAVVLVVHGSGDWITFFPGLAAPALGLLGAAVAVRTRTSHSPADGRDGRRTDVACDERPPSGPLTAGASPGRARRRSPVGAGRRAAAGAALLVVLAAAGAAVPLLLAARLTDHAVATWRTAPARALADLARARHLNPLASAIPLNEGVIAVELRDDAVARRAFTEAARRDPGAWYPRLALALLDARAGRREQALAGLRAAGERNPREPLIAPLTRSISRGSPPDVRRVQRQVLARSA